MKTLIIGGTGSVGSLVVKELVERGADLRILARESSNITGLPNNVGIARGDLLDIPSVERAFDGVDSVYLLNGVVPDELTQALVVFNLAVQKEVAHFVYHSVFQSERFPGVPHFASKAAVELAIRQSGLSYTILKPNYFPERRDAAAGDPGLWRLSHASGPRRHFSGGHSRHRRAHGRRAH
ncbi:MAG TPA: NmrA family NAD(P)-binding protein [Chthoniobacterales bacterium]